jgi:hypothetical protein
MTPRRPNPSRLNPLQLKTLTILQALAQEQDFAEPPGTDGSVRIHSLPPAHGNHVHLGQAVAAVRDLTGLANQSVLNALARKGLLKGGPGDAYTLTSTGLDYDTGIAHLILHRGDH